MASVRASTYRSDVDFNFDAFALKSKEQMIALLLKLCKSVGVHKLVKKSDKELTCFFQEIAERMPPNPYHNLTHITDVTQFCCTVIRQTKLSEWLPPLSIVALFFAAVCHDLEHPGFSNALVINDMPALANKYKHDCPLERHHVACCQELMSKHKICSDLSSKDAALVMRTAEAVIMSTDMGKHKTIIDQFDVILKKAETDPTIVASSDNALCVQLLKVLMKSSDISNQARAGAIAWKWNIAVYTEFYREGDIDRKKGRQVNPLHDRHSNVISKSTVGFIKFVVRPLVTLLNRAVQVLKRAGAPLNVSGLKVPLANLDANTAKNMERGKNDKPGLPAAV